jgi:hypothetical protein
MALSITDYHPTRLQNHEGWKALLRRLPPDLDQSAFEGLALFRHRGFPSAALLLRLILAYACGLSMPMVTAWAAAQRLVTITPEALQYRIKGAHRWMSSLVLHLLTHRAGPGTEAVAGLPLTVRLIDGTPTPRPGAKGTDWRVHCSLDLRTQRLDDVQLTSEKEGESFARFTPQPGEVFLGDRNFGTRRGIWHVIRHGAEVLVRVILSNLPLQTRSGTPFPVWDCLRTLAPETCGDWEVQTKAIPATKKTEEIPAIPGRLVAFRLSPAAALKAREQHRKRRSRNGDGPPGAATVEGWEYVVLFTTLPACLYPASVILALYRFRWQIEMAIKRYKSLCGLAQIHTRLSTSCQTVLWAKLLLILLLEDLGARTEAFPPSAGGCGASDQLLALDSPPYDEFGRLDYSRVIAEQPRGVTPRVGTLSH